MLMHVIKKIGRGKYDLISPYRQRDQSKLLGGVFILTMQQWGLVTLN